MITWEQFIEKKIQDRKSQIRGALGTRLMPRPQGVSKTAHKAKKKEYMQSEEFQSKLEQELKNDERYRILTSEKSKEDMILLTEYKQLCILEEAKEEEKRIDECIDGFFDYLEERGDMLLDLAEEFSDGFDREFQIDLTTSEISFQLTDYDYDWNERERYVDLSPDNLDDFLYHLDEIMQDEKEEFFCDLDFIDETLIHLQKKDSKRFAEELNKIKQCVPDADVEKLRDMLAKRDFYDFLDERLPEVSEIVNSSGVQCDVPSEKEVMRLLSYNPYYSNMLKKQKQEKEEAERRQKLLEQGIIDRIPENPVDLYPLARQMQRHFILHIGPTNSGKTHHAILALEKAETGIYLGPLRLLAAECFDRMNADGVPTSMITGEEERIVEGAKHTSSTIELLNTAKHYDVAVIDEGQMLTDEQRGGGWTAAVLGVLAEEVHICAAPPAENILVKMITECGDSYEVVRHKRSVPLRFDNKKFKFPQSVQKHDALIVFSKWKVLACAAELQAKGIPCSVIYGALPYEARQNEVKRFLDGKTDVIVSTDAIGMGMNLPISRIVFLETKKYDGKITRQLNVSEVQQIAGRAGRQGMYEEGLYTSEFDQKLIREKAESSSGMIGRARLGFSPALVPVEGKLSEIMRQWSKMPDNGYLQKTDISEMIELSTELEEYTEDKQLIYSFVTIPFNTKDDDMKRVWKNAFREELRGEHLPFADPCPKKELGSLEDAYQYCDLMYFYHRRFTDGSDLKTIMECKRRITKDIIQILATKKLPTRKCSECGKPISWNYPYKMCQACYESRRSRWYGYYDDYYDDY